MGYSQRKWSSFYWEHAAGKKVRISFDRKVEILGINTFEYACVMNFDTVLNNKESVDYVIRNLSKANFDPELFTSHNHEIQNNLIINLLPYNNEPIK
jgi:hypothetical protein